VHRLHDRWLIPAGWDDERRASAEDQKVIGNGRYPTPSDGTGLSLSPHHIRTAPEREKGRTAAGADGGFVSSVVGPWRARQRHYWWAHSFSEHHGSAGLRVASQLWVLCMAVHSCRKSVSVQANELRSWSSEGQ
jgi:hypothetical protein